MEHEFLYSDIRVKFNGTRQYTFADRITRLFRPEEIIAQTKAIRDATAGGGQREELLARQLASALGSKPAPARVANSIITNSSSSPIDLTQYQLRKDKQLTLGTKKEKYIQEVKQVYTYGDDDYTFYSYIITNGGGMKNKPSSLVKDSYACFRENNAIGERYPQLLSRGELSVLVTEGHSPTEFDDFYPYFLIEQVSDEESDVQFFRQMMPNAIGYSLYTSIMGETPFNPDDYAKRLYVLINVGKVGSAVYGGKHYYSFVVRNDGTVFVIKNVKTQGEGYDRFIVAKSSINLKLDLYERRVPLQFIIMPHGRDTYVILFVGNPLYNETTEYDRAVPFEYFGYTTGILSSGGLSEELAKNVFAFRITPEMGTPFADVSFYLDYSYNAIFSGMFTPFNDEFAFMVPVYLGYNVTNRTLYKHNFGVLLMRDKVTNNLVANMFDGNGYLRDDATNMEFTLSLFVYDTVTGQLNRVHSVNTPSFFILVKGRRIFTPYPERMFMRGIFGVVLYYDGTVNQTITFPHSVEFQGSTLKKFVKTISLSRSKFGEDNSARIELTKLPHDPEWTFEMDALFNMGMMTVEIYKGQRPVFSGQTTIDSYKQVTEVLTDSLQFATLNFEEEWIRRAKENTVFIPEELGYTGMGLRTHAQAVKYILASKLGIPESNMYIAEDNIPLPTVAVVSYESPYTMIMGKDFYSYLENIVNNYSGWVLYRNYALNPDNDAGTYLVYKPKPLQAGVYAYTAYFYKNHENYVASPYTPKAKIVGNITVEKKRPFGSALSIVTPVTLPDSKYVDMIVRQEIVTDVNNPDYIGQHVLHTVYVPYSYDIFSPINLDILKRELALRVLYGFTTITFRSAFLPHLHYYSHVWIEGYGEGVIKGMTVTMTDRGVFCDYTVTLATGGVIYQW